MRQLQKSRLEAAFAATVCFCRAQQMRYTFCSWSNKRLVCRCKVWLCCCKTASRFCSCKKVYFAVTKFCSYNSGILLATANDTKQTSFSLFCLTVISITTVCKICFCFACCIPFRFDFRSSPVILHAVAHLVRPENRTRSDQFHRFSSIC